MATTRTSRSSRNTRSSTGSGTNAMNIQRKINRDYVQLARDYARLAGALWEKPVTKFLLAGAALGAVAAVFKRYPELNDYVSEGMSELKDKVNDVIHSSDDMMA